MSKPQVVLYKKSIAKELIAQLEKHFEVSIFDGIKNDLPGFMKAMETAQGLIGWGGRLDEKLLEASPYLKAVSTISVGYDHCDVAAMTKRNIALMHTPDVLTDAVADAALTLILCVARRTLELDPMLRQGQWTSTLGPQWYGTDVYGKTLGVVGMGRIGKAIAKRCHLGFDMPILYHSRSQHKDAEQEFKATHCDLDTLLKKSDFVCSVLPNTPKTKHMLGAKEFQKMRPTGIFINVGRGSVVDEAALFQALDKQVILGAGLDVYEKEPLTPDSPLTKLKNVVLTPHTASATHETRHAMDVCAVNNLIQALTTLNGSPEKNCVNPEVFHQPASF